MYPSPGNFASRSRRFAPDANPWPLGPGLIDLACTKPVNSCQYEKKVSCMDEITKNELTVKVCSPNDHMANERTFLAWIRTSIGIMAFGFVVEKFSFFIKKISLFVGKSPALESATSSSGYSSIFGIVLVVLGTVMGVLAFVRYKKVEKEIDDNAYRPSLFLDILLTMLVVGMGAFFVIFMIYSI
jgi:uncharacterized membrane protein YidH (DUF202 family)